LKGDKDIRWARQQLKLHEREHAHLAHMLAMGDRDQQMEELRSIEKQIEQERKRQAALASENRNRERALARIAKEVEAGEMELDSNARALQQVARLEAELGVWKVKNTSLEKQVQQTGSQLQSAKEQREAAELKAQQLAEELNSEDQQMRMAEHQAQEERLNAEEASLRECVAELQESRRKATKIHERQVKERARELSELKEQQAELETRLRRVEGEEKEIRRQLRSLGGGSRLRGGIAGAPSAASPGPSPRLEPHAIGSPASSKPLARKRPAAVAAEEDFPRKMVLSPSSPSCGPTVRSPPQGQGVAASVMQSGSPSTKQVADGANDVAQDEETQDATMKEALGAEEDEDALDASGGSTNLADDACGGASESGRACSQRDPDSPSVTNHVDVEGVEDGGSGSEAQSPRSSMDGSLDEEDRSENESLAEEEERAAIVIQRHAKGALTRRRVSQEREEAAQVEDLEVKVVESSESTHAPPSPQPATTAEAVGEPTGVATEMAAALALKAQLPPKLPPPRTWTFSDDVPSSQNSRRSSAPPRSRAGSDATQQPAGRSGSKRSSSVSTLAAAAAAAPQPRRRPDRG